MKTHSSSIATGLTLAVALFGAACSRVNTGEPVGYVKTTSAPFDVTAHPSAEYQGHTVYFVSGLWMYRDRGGWAYYRSEPAELRKYRPSSETPQTAP